MNDAGIIVAVKIILIVIVIFVMIIVIVMRASNAVIPVIWLGGKVLAHSANSIAVSKGTLDDGIKFNLEAKKSDRSCGNGVDTATAFLE